MLLCWGKDVSAGVKFSEACVVAAKQIKSTPLENIPAKCKLLTKLQQWRMLRRHELKFEDGVRFMEENPSWPLRSETLPELEKLITEKTPSTVMQRWFLRHPPTTYEGLSALLSVLTHDDHVKKKVSKVFEKVWARATFINLSQQNHLLKHYGNLLTSRAHQQRIEFLLWRKETSLAKPLLPLIEKNKQQTYLYWMRRIEKPEGLYVTSTHPGIVAIDAETLLASDKASEAANLILVAEPKRVFTLENSFFVLLQQVIRQLILEKKHLLASDVAQKGLTWSGKNDKCRNKFLWLSGWVLSQYLGQQEKAVAYFVEAFKRTRNSDERAQYAFWAARSAQAKHPKTATKWMSAAANYPQTFYGQMAARNLGSSFLKVNSVSVSKKGRLSFQKNELPRAIQLMATAGQDDLKNILLDGLVGTLKTAEEVELSMELLQKYGTPYYQIHFFQEANKHYNLNGEQVLFRLTLPDMCNVDPMFVHSLIFHESRFHPTIKSGKNAVGLMQITPLTATHLRNKKHDADERKLYYNPEYHLKVGAIYLDELFRRFNQSYVLLAMAYNAGPTYTASWMRKIGEPRDIYDVSWIEQINLKETRDYVKKVLGTWLLYQRHQHPDPAHSPKELLDMYESGK